MQSKRAERCLEKGYKRLIRLLASSFSCEVEHPSICSSGILHCLRRMSSAPHPGLCVVIECSRAQCLWLVGWRRSDFVLWAVSGGLFFFGGGGWARHAGLPAGHDCVV